MGDTKKAWYKKWWAILLIFILTLMLITIIILGFSFLNYYRQFKNDPLLSNTLAPNQKNVDLKKIEGEDAYWLGSAKPKLTIVEFGDFSCVACKNSFSTLREISLKYKDKVKIIFRDLPIISEYSIKLSLGAKCAGEQGLFWPMYDKLYLNQGISTNQEIKNVFSQIGGNPDKFAKCLDSMKYYKDIQKDIADADALGLKGTPSWFINGNNINGEIPRDVFLDLVGKILKAS